MTVEGPLEGGGADDDTMAPPIGDIDAKLAVIRGTAQRLAAMMLSADDADDIAQEIVSWACVVLPCSPRHSLT